MGQTEKNRKDRTARTNEARKTTQTTLIKQTR